MDLKEFMHERFRRLDEKLDKIIDALTEIRTHQAAMLQILASHDNPSRGRGSPHP